MTDPTTIDAREPRPGDHVEVTYRGVLRSATGDGIQIECLDRPGGELWFPETGTIRVIDPPEPTAVNTVVTGWPGPDDRAESLYVYVLWGRDEDGDGAQRWANAMDGTGHELTWGEVLAHTVYGRRIIPPAAG